MINLVVNSSSSSSSSPTHRGDISSASLLSPEHLLAAPDVLLYVRHFFTRLTHLASCRAFQLAFVAVSVLLFLVIYTTVRANPSANEDFPSDFTSSSSLVSVKKQKVILFWTKWFDKSFPKMWNGGGSKAFLENCPKNSDLYANCDLTDDRRRIKEADAVVFHVPDLVGQVSLLGGYDVPSYRTPNQRYVFYNQESPAHTLTRLSAFEHFFNWTMTYRRDSDLWAPYAKFLPRNLSSDSRPKPVDMLQNKTGWVAWVVSRCYTHSRREHYVENLKKYIPVDVWGRCGPMGHCDGQCFDNIARTYRFYISIENSLCTDYVTEKFFTRMQELDAILIVLQPKNISGSLRDNYAHLAPPNSYVDASKFDSPKMLASYLRAVGSEPTMFSSFFNWRSNLTIKRSMFDPLCDMCRKLQDDSIAPKTYADIREWWVGGTRRRWDGSVIESASQPHCQPGSKFNADGEESAPPYQTPYFIHIQS